MWDPPFSTPVILAFALPAVQRNPSRVAVLMDVPDMDAFKAAMQTKAAADALTSDGVVPESLVILVES